MISFMLRRALQAIFVMLCVAFIAFLMFSYLGDPVLNMVGADASLAERDAVRQALGLNDPLPVRYAAFVWRMLHGDFGVSYRLGMPVASLIAARLPATLELSFCAVFLSIIVGIPAGIYTAIRRNSLSSHVLLIGSLVGVSLPTFLIGMFLILFFSVDLGWLPSFGRGDTVSLGGWNTGFLTLSGLRSLILPTITLAFFQTTLIVRLVRAEMLEVLEEDYIRFARARGLSDRVIWFKEALKNTLVPVTTIIGLQMGAVIAFSIITETVFQWPGLGLLFINAVEFADVPILASYLVLVSAFFVVLNLAVDLLYYRIDPRLRGSQGASR
ncbi:ABC transporter permease [Martelella alba]|uniref:ABC transporter permease n=1 Tax=Martelella alba TaxID=2590451 RepID=A0A506UEL1_9HYPH|nr:ABC transporter permease [Martelella alba]TPW32108.1 ABC transporter permease [Martelella alba]